MNDYSAQQLTPSLGAEITGIDLSNDLSNEQLNQIYDDLIKYNVIFFRDQKISPEKHIEIAKSFGTIEEPHPIYPHVEGFPEIVLLKNDSGQSNGLFGNDTPREIRLCCRNKHRISFSVVYWKIYSRT